MIFTDAQKDMDYSYYGGATGVLVSGLIWCIAGLIGLTYSTQASMYALFIGGMFIFPLSMLMSKVLKRSGKHKPERGMVLSNHVIGNWCAILGFQHALWE